MRSFRRVAPTALKISTHHRFFWDLSAFSFCPETGDVLLDDCPFCHRPLRWLGGVSIHKCGHCKADLRLAPVQKADFCDDESLKFLGDLVSTDFLRQQRALLTLHPSLRSLNRGSIIELAFMAGWSLQDDCLGQGRLLPATFKSCPEAIVHGARILRRYPEAIQEQLGGSGPLMSRYSIALQMRGTRNVNTETKVFVGKLLENLIPRRVKHTLAKARAENHRLTITEASKHMKIGKADLRRLIETGLVSSQPIRGELRQIDWFHELEVARVADELADKVSVNEAIGETGLAYHVIEQIFGAGHLALHSTATMEQVFACNFFRRRDFQSLLDKLREKLTVTALEDPDRISVENCFRVLGGRYKPWGQLISAALDGTLPGDLGVYDVNEPWTPKNLNVSRLLRQRILAGVWPTGQQVITGRLSCTWAEAQEYLNCLPRDLAYLLANDQVLRIDKHLRGIRRSDVVEVGKCCISSAEIAARLDIKTVSVGSWARRLGLKRPEHKFPFWRREDVVDHLPEMSLQTMHLSELSHVMLAKKA